MRTLSRCGALILLVLISIPSLQADDRLDQILNQFENMESNPEAAAKAQKAIESMTQGRPGNSSADGSSSEGEITHFRSSKGIPFPKPESVVLRPYEPMSDEEIEAMSRKVFEGSESRTPVPAEKPSRCPGPNIHREPVDYGTPGVVYSDIVYVPEELVPPDPSEAFGPGVDVYGFRSSGDYAMYNLFRSNGVKCVPYRIRIVGREVIRYQGREALKNFDPKSQMEGTLHPWVRNKMDAMVLK